MDYNHSSAFTSDYSDWFGIPASPGPRADEALISLGSAGSTSTFDRDVDTALAEMGSMTPADWDQIINDPLLFNLPACTATPSDNDMASSISTIFDPLSPISDGTLVDSPSSYSSALPVFKFGFQDDPVEYFRTPFPPNDFGFTSQSEQPVSFSALSRPPITPTFSGPLDGLGEQQQYEVGAAGALYGPVVGVQASRDESAFAFTTPPVAQRDTLVVPEVKDENVVAHKSPLADDVDEKQRAPKRRRQQDTTPRFPCPHCTSRFARTYNLRVHVSSVHGGERKHRCTDTGCDRAFSRKHDLTRHIQSKHTDLGSPRNKNNSANKVAKVQSTKNKRSKN